MAVRHIRHNRREAKMPATAVIGLQWGDEGKGKIVDLFAEKADIVCRFQGGANAGHTIVVNGNKIVLHLVPSGILWPHTTCLIGPEVVLDPETFLAEVAELEKNGIKCRGRLFISSRTSLVMLYHKDIDQLREKQASKKIGTTGRGIGPAYEDLVGRRAVRIADLDNPETYERQVVASLGVKNFYGHPELDLFFTHPYKAIDLLNLRNIFNERLQPFAMNDMTSFVNEALEKNRRVLFEGAQGILLDYVNGTYPYVTSSHTHPAAICTSFGIAPKWLTEIIGVAKAYTTRVGEGPFPTELHGEEAECLRQAGNEYGATTGRPRRCGWLDLPAIRYACRISGATRIIFTKFDVLAHQSNVKVNNSYQLRGKTVRTLNIEDISNCVANNEIIFPDWKPSFLLNQVTTKFIYTIRQLLNTPIAAVSLGAEREKIMWLN
jgi:adenylosuccinate synthase